MKRRIAVAAIITLACAAAVTAARESTVLPTGWRLQPPQGAVAIIGTMPQGIALSPDGGALAVVESGVRPPALRLLQPADLHQDKAIDLKGAFGRPVWVDVNRVLVAGANSDSVFDINVSSGAVTSALDVAKGAWPAAVARSSDGTIATANDGDGTVNVGSTAIHVGDHPADVLFSPDGKTLYASVRQTNSIAVIDTANKTMTSQIRVGRHPEALAFSADGKTLYVAESDDDTVGVIDLGTQKRVRGIAVGLNQGRLQNVGASPNALFVHGNDLFVALGAENAVALVRGDRLVERIPAGWYPTDVAIARDDRLLVSNGYGEGTHANPEFNPLERHSAGYVASITVGSVRAIPAAAWARAAYETQGVIAAAQPQWTAPPLSQTVLRSGGPIKHVIYIIKENRTYDQILGDLPGANGNAKLAMFGSAATPNQHAIAKRFGIFDNAYTDAQVSAPGHNWTDAAFSNDFVERRWPPNYGDRMQSYDFQTGAAPDVPHNGYLWDAAKRAHLTYRDYGEDIDTPQTGPKIGINTFPGLTGHFDPAYVGWDLKTSDEARYAEWQREFDRFAQSGTVPQLEIVYFPNDHTSGTKPGMPTPQAYIATNDWVVGRLVEHVSHSKVWSSTAIFALEDDAQNGPDHVSAQRSTFYVASPYARGGVHHAHYSTSSFVRTIELILGLEPLSIYDATTRPLYDAFTTAPRNIAAYTAIKPRVDMSALNAKTAYRAKDSARLDFSRPDAADEETLNDIVMHAR